MLLRQKGWRDHGARSRQPLGNRPDDGYRGARSD